MHIFNMLITSVESFEPKNGLSRIILSKIIFSNSHMFIFNRLVTSVQSFKLIACIVWYELITQTCFGSTDGQGQ